MTKSNSGGRGFILDYGSRGIGVHHGGKAWQQAAGFGMGTGSWEIASLAASTKQKEQMGRRAVCCQSRVPSNIRPQTRSHLLKLPKWCHQLRTKCSASWTDRGHSQFKLPPSAIMQLWGYIALETFDKWYDITLNCQSIGNCIIYKHL